MTGSRQMEIQLAGNGRGAALFFPIHSAGNLLQYQRAEGQVGLALSQGKHLSSHVQVYLRLATLLPPAFG